MDIHEKWNTTTPERRLQKWSPVLDALKVTDEKKRQFMADYAEFHMYNDFKEWEIDPEREESEKRYNEKYHFEGPPQNPLKLLSDPDVGQNLLPISMSIISKLNLDGKNYEIKEGLPTNIFYEELTDEKIKEWNGWKKKTDIEGQEKVWSKSKSNPYPTNFMSDEDWKSMNEYMNDYKWIDVVEKLLYKRLVDTVNKELETKNTIYIQSMANKLMLRNDGTTDTPKPVLYLYSRYEVK